jgi:hypothetical protein
MKNRLTFTLLWVSLLLPTMLHARAPQAQSLKPKQGAEQITAEENKQAREVSERFIQRLQETRDLAPIMDEMFTDTFRRRIEQDPSLAGIVGQGTSLMEYLIAKQRLRCFVVSFNFEYLLRLYLFSKVSFESPDVSQSEELLPVKIKRFLKEKAPAEEEIKSAKQANKFLAFLEQVVTLIQEEVRQNPPEATEQFKKNLAAFEAHLNQFPQERPSVRVYETSQFGYAAGTRLTRMVIPFHVGLLMVKVGNTIKLDGVGTHLPPD